MTNQKKTLLNIYDKNLNKFVLLIWKDVYLYDFMNNSENFKETFSPSIENFHVNQNLKSIIKYDAKNLKTREKNWIILKMKNLCTK